MNYNYPTGNKPAETGTGVDVCKFLSSGQRSCQTVSQSVQQVLKLTDKDSMEIEDLDIAWLEWLFFSTSENRNFIPCQAEQLFG